MARADWPYATRIAQSSGTELPSAVAVRNWGPSRRVYFVVETIDTSGGGSTVAELYRYLCFGGASCSPSLWSVGIWPKAVGGTVGAVEFLHTSMAIRVDEHSVEEVDIIRREKIDPDCDNDGDTTEAAEEALDLQNYDYRTDTNQVATRLLVSSNFLNSTNNACTDSGVSQLKHGASALNACYTFKANPLNGALDRLRCNDDSGSPFWQWGNPVDLTSTVVEDHPAFGFKDGERVVVGSRRPAGTNNDEIRFHFPDAGGSPEPNFGLGLGVDVAGGIVPDVATVAVTGGDVTYAVWEAEGGTEIRVGRCPATEDCEQSGDWTVTTARSTTDGLLGHPEIAHDGAFQILIWEEDEDEDDTTGERIYAMTRCGGTGTWSTPEVIRTPSSSTKSQTILLSNPHLVLNRSEQVAHVAFVEYNTVTQASEVWWARKDYTECE